MATHILRLPALMKSTGMPRSTLYLQVSRGLLPPPIRLGARSVGWPANEIDQVLAARIAGNNEEQVRELVGLLIARRQTKGGEVQQ